jgi:hypothetical protein
LLFLIVLLLILRSRTLLLSRPLFGGQVIVEGNYPIDYITRVEKFFPSQKDAEAAAEAISLAEVNAEKILGAAA